MEKEFDKENTLETVETVENTEEASVNTEAETEQAAE